MTQSAHHTQSPVLLARPHITEEDIEAVVEVLRSGWITTGMKVRELEGAFADRVSARHAVAVNSGTAALHLALEALGLSRGDEVIVPTMTFTATAEVVRYFDAVPVLADVSPDTLCLNPEAACRAVTSRTRAIIPVHYGGHPADMAPILELASSRGIAVVEDAAHSFPAQYKGREIGTIGDATAFSFYATKTITTGEGGMLVTDRDDIAERARIMSLHGMSRDAWKRYTSTGSWRYDVVAPGFKYNMTDMAAALGVSQLRRADWFLERRTAIARQYSAALAESGGIQPPVAREDVEHSWHLYVLRIRPKELRIDRDRFIQELDARGVRAGVHFIPLHQFTYYRETYGYSDAQFPVATKEFETMLSLPIYPSMTENDVSQVVSAVLDVADTYRR